MSISRDDYGPTHGKSPGTAEPADPSSPNHTARQELPLAPTSVKVERLPDPLTDNDQPLSVNEAATTFLKTQRASWTSDNRSSKYERHRYELYPRILGADRHFQAEYEGLTTAMLTRRLSPLDDAGNWVTPWECDDMLHGGTIHRSVRGAINYQLEGFEYEWVAVTAPTTSAGTPHEHRYFWIDDSENSVTTDHLASALDKHLKHCANAYRRDHRYQADGMSGAITVRHDPPIVKEHPDKMEEIIKQTDTLEPNTRGAQYLSSQLAHLPLGDFYSDERENPPQALFEGAALAWASPRKWFRASRGVPD